MYKVNLHSSIEGIEASRWDALCDPSYPFMRHAFLHALEASGSVSAKTGWQPLHLEVMQDNTCVLVMPLYLKSHSWGEYVFDWAWADAYERNGLAYYPKLLNAIPFTPASGPRYGTSLSEAEALSLIPEVLEQVMQEVNASSWHCLFPPAYMVEHTAKPVLKRLGCQYHWFNRDYREFDDFLARFNARKRKSVKRERRKVKEQGIQLQCLSGSQVQPEQLDQFYHFYQSTYLKRGRQGYLSADFFHRLHQTMPEHLLLVEARREDLSIAGALYFIGERTLYGRYWGCSADHDSLHFEACYYQGIEYCIEHGLQRFDPGAQGEHKIQRGFEPVETWSLHRIADPRFQQAIEAFLEEERDLMEQQIAELTTWLPFRQPDS
ncbi:GNAT family N-acetyltransferase [Marinobacterium maritimum]|uniref:GNAT family N-acetyltransferase n=1 Tax=Marinobacterium maritimum TaxID=500162 RepID=A0ABP3T735_9GAMM